MAPRRKKAKVAHIVGGTETAPAPTSSTSTPVVVKSVLSIVEAMFTLRHSDEKSIHSENIGNLEVKNGIYPWPVKHGGTFKDVAQRAWADADVLLAKSARLTHMVGLMDSPDTTEFLQEFLKVEAVCEF